MTDQRPGEKDWEVTPNTYIFAGVGAVILGSPMQPSAASNTIAAARRACGRQFGTFLLISDQSARSIGQLAPLSDAQRVGRLRRVR
jgi:hypothetical protein